MSAGRKAWNVGWRISVGLLLLLWIFHSIFLKEGRLAWEKQGHSWNALSRFQQWKIGWTFGPSELWDTLTAIHPLPFAGSLLLVGATVFLGIIRWKMVLTIQGIDLPFRRTTAISFVAHFFNSFLLGSTGGDLMKAYYAARETAHKKTEAVVTVFVDRLIGFWAMLFFAGIMMLPNIDFIVSSERITVLSLIIIAMLIGCSVLLLLAFWGGVSRKWPQAKNLLRKLPKGELLQRSLESCRQFGRHPVFLLKAIAISLAINAACVFQVMLLAHGLNLEISSRILFVIVPIITSISALPITPSGIGVRENLFVLILAAPAIAVAATPALSISLLTYAGGLFWSIVGGLVYLTLREREHLTEVTQPEAAS